jgi:hypothetical protein
MTTTRLQARRAKEQHEASHWPNCFPLHFIVACFAAVHAILGFLRDNTAHAASPQYTVLLSCGAFLGYRLSRMRTFLDCFYIVALAFGIINQASIHWKTSLSLLNIIIGDVLHYVYQ